jgi:DNA/RNA-binding domain of Phe-tRNA-synthetase-like protein
MSSFEYRIAPEIFQSHPGYCRGVVVLDIAHNEAGPLTAPLTQQLREAEQTLRATVTGNVAEHPRIAAWRDAYRAFGAKPSEHRSAVEALTRRVLKPDALPDINPLVDIGNLITLRFLLPAGVHPVPASAEAAVSLSLRKTAEGDRFLPPDGSPAEQPAPGEIVFAHGQEVLTRRWTWRQAAGTQTQPDTRQVLVNIDGLPPASEAEVRAALQAVTELAQQYCDAHVRATQVLTAQQPLLSWT